MRESLRLLAPGDPRKYCAVARGAYSLTIDMKLLATTPCPGLRVDGDRHVPLVGPQDQLGQLRGIGHRLIEAREARHVTRHHVGGPVGELIDVGEHHEHAVGELPGGGEPLHRLALESATPELLLLLVVPRVTGPSWPPPVESGEPVLDVPVASLPCVPAAIPSSLQAALAITHAIHARPRPKLRPKLRRALARVRAEPGHLRGHLRPFGPRSYAAQADEWQLRSTGPGQMPTHGV